MTVVTKNPLKNQIITALHASSSRLLAALACLQGLLNCEEGLQACLSSAAAVVLAAQLDVRDSERSRVAVAMLRRLAGHKERGYAQVVAALLEEANTTLFDVFVDAPEHLYYVPQRLVAFLDLFQVCAVAVFAAGHNIDQSRRRMGLCRSIWS